MSGLGSIFIDAGDDPIDAYFALRMAISHRLDETHVFHDVTAMSQSFAITSFYQFSAIDAANLLGLRDSLERTFADQGWCGLIILSPEGFNGTVACLSPDRDRLKQFVCDTFKTGALTFKDSDSSSKPFRRFDVKVRNEAVTSELSEDILATPIEKAQHELSPEEWQKTLEEEPDVAIIDVRNWYETKLGRFRNCIDPRTDNFQQFKKFLEVSDLPRDKKVLMYCTGGIRCEKAMPLMKSLGFEKFYALEGGILNYLKEFPDRNFDGECFVFDRRVSLDQNLAPSGNFKLCPICGQPGNVRITCRYCECDGTICENCHKDENKQACSLNCAYHVKKGSARRSKGKSKGKKVEERVSESMRAA